MESEKVKNKIRDQRRGHAHNKDKVRSHSSLLPSLPDRTGRRVRISLRNAALPVRNQERGDQSRPPCIFYINHGKAGSSHPLTPVRTLPPCLPQVHVVLCPEQSSLGAPSQAQRQPSSPRFRHSHGQCPSCQRVYSALPRGVHGAAETRLCHQEGRWGWAPGSDQK